MEILTSRSVLSRSSSSGVHLFIWFVDTRLLPLWPSALAPDVAGLGFAFSGALNIERQSIALAHVVRIDACGLQRGDVEKNIRTAGIVSDETEAAASVPHFQYAGCHSISLSPSWRASCHGRS